MTNRELFFRHLGLPSFFPMDLEIVKAEGVYFFDVTGKKYFDLVAGITVSNTGHRHPAVLSAIRDQLERYLHLNVYGEFIQSPQVKFAGKLASLLPQSLDSVYFVNSGSEAIEGAMKLAKRFTGRTKIVSFENAYHGSTQGALSIMGGESLKNAFRPLLPETFQLRFNCLEDIDLIDEDTACVVFELIQAEAGIVRIEPDFLSALVQKCRELGVLMVVDDVQMGLGRCGTMFSFEQFGFVPDILVLAKALGGGLPLGAFIAGKKIMDTLAYSPELGHITTFGGHPLSCAAGLAALEIVEKDRLTENTEIKGLRFEKYLSQHTGFAAIRRAGLALGIDLKDPGKKVDFMKAAMSEGVIIDWYLFRPATFRIAPPLNITDEEIDEACQLLINAMKSIQ
jgi:acetylornithine/succinyldiaminopimelate/putrescine aminotransferase